LFITGISLTLIDWDGRVYFGRLLHIPQPIVTSKYNKLRSNTVSDVIAGLKPEPMWRHFYGITQIPRPSKKEEKVLAYLTDLLKNMGYDYEQDAVGNIVVRKPATPGHEKAPMVLIQGHVDMVCEKNKGTEFDFDNEPIKVYRDGDWITAEGTTLGADNGIGLAAGLAVLEAKDLVHGPMEFLFTVDEETGMTGAKELKPGFLKADIMLNLDSEEDGTLYVGCAGGMDTAGHLDLKFSDAPSSHVALEFIVSGLKGGHSGLDIHSGRANAIKVLARAMQKVFGGHDAYLSTMAGGSKRNAIPREAEAIIYVPKGDVEPIKAAMVEMSAMLSNEMQSLEPDVAIEVNEVAGNGKVAASDQATTLWNVLYVLPHGVIKFSNDIAGLVETSTNLATVTMNGDRLTIGTSQRSSVNSEKMDAVAMVVAGLALAGLEVENGDGYPGWQPNMQSLALKETKESFKQLYGDYPAIKAIHAGLECGLIGEVFPKMEMISFGPTIEGAHSPDERLNIPTSEKFWNLLVKLLENLAKN
jgi:dipeptidase D